MRMNPIGLIITGLILLGAALVVAYKKSATFRRIVDGVWAGLNPRARYEALAFYDREDTNGTELRAVAGNFLFSTGANEFADRFTEGHFDIPVFNTTMMTAGSVM